MKKVLYKLLSNKYLWLILFFLRNIIASAHDCSSPGDCEETAGYNAAVAIVGGAVALGVGLMGAGFTTTVSEGDETQPDEEVPIEETEGNEEQGKTGVEDDEESDDIRIEDDEKNEELRIKEEEQKKLEQERQKKEALAAAEAERQRKEFELKRQKEIQKQKEIREKALQKLKEIEKEKIRREKYINKLCEKYHTTPDQLRNVIRKNINKSQADADAWNSYEKKLAIAEAAAKMTVIVADTAIDGLAHVTGPAGKGIRAGYKVLKNVGSTMADKGVSGSSFASGLVKGGADAATDFIENPYLKAGTTVLGETVGGAITDGKKGAIDGFVKGAFTAGVNQVTGKLAGPGYGNKMKMTFNKDGTATVIMKSRKFIISGKNAIDFANNKISKQFVESGVKATSATINEMGIKPKVKEHLGIDL